MDIKYTDQQIAELIDERKVLPDDWRTQLDKNNSLYIIAERGNRFRIITNLNTKYPTDFSVILAVVNPKKGADFRIRRYNGMHKRPHNNKIEKKFTATTFALLQSVIRKEVMTKKLTQKKQTSIITLKVPYVVLYRIQILNYQHSKN